jgi:phage-related minor tail protein
LAYLLAGNAEFGAKGLAYNNGNLINNATVFGTNSGLAVGGELGTEAIMPLSRGADGRLGVTVNGAGGGNVNINFTINAVDAKGIDTMLVERKSLITNIVRSAMQDRGVRI